MRLEYNIDKISIISIRKFMRCVRCWDFVLKKCLRMRAAEIRGWFPEDILEFLSAETKTVHKVYKLRGNLILIF